MSASRIRPLLICLLAVVATAVSAAEPRPRKVVVVAGAKSHGPEGNRIHDYPWSAKLIKAMLLKSNVRDRVTVEVVRDGWPKDDAILADADAVMIISDGRDGDLYAEAPHLESPERVAAVQKLIDRGCGLLTFHFSTFGPDRFADSILDWTGGYFDWEEDGQRKWYSAIELQDADVVPVNATHPVLRGVKPFHLKEEFYFNLRFEPPNSGAGGDKSAAAPLEVLAGTTTPLIVVPTLPGRDALGQTVAWARERDGGGRGFGTTCGHFYDNWQNDQFRKLVLNAIVWSAKSDVPAEGVDAPFLSRRDICEALGETFDATLAGEAEAAANPREKDVPESERIRVLMFAGNEAHKWHNWEKTTPAIEALLEVDPRIQVDVSYDIEDLAKRLSPAADGRRPYDVIVQNNYANWHDPRSLSEPSRAAFVEFLKSGGGLVLVHFANGAWHFSLPEAGDSDWPEYRNIVRRVWNHQGPEATRSSHDAFGEFTVRPTPVDSPLTQGLEPFTLQDELYFSQQGDQPIEPLITATSKVTKKDEPLAWTYSYGDGHVFQTLLGHSEKTYDVFGPREMLRRAVAWCAGKEIRKLTPKDDVAVKAARSTERLVPGRFGRALNAAAKGLFVVAGDQIRRPAITVEAWVRLHSSGNFNILVASEEKSSPDHWELYSYAGTGALSVYLPGHGGEYKSDARVCDGEWHHVAMQLEPAQVRLFVDGQTVLDRAVEPAFPSPETASGGETLLAIGRLVEDGLGCDGEIDEVRIRRGARAVTVNTDQPLESDRDTRALWRFEALADGKAVNSEKGKLPAMLDRPVLAAAPKKEVNHWGKELVGFDWYESDSVDGRWEKTAVGTFLGSVIPIDGQPAEKGLTIKVGEPSAGAVCYDTGRGQMRAAWLDGFLKFHPARYGLIEAPSPNGRPVFSSSRHPGFGSIDAAEKPAFHYRGLWRNGSRTVLEWTAGETLVRESPWLETVGDLRLVTRDFEIGPGSAPLTISLIQRPAAWERIANGNTQIVVVRDGDEAVAFAVVAPPEAFELKAHDSRAVELVAAARNEATTARVFCWRGAAGALGEFAKAVAAAPAAAPMTALAAAGPPQWTDSIVTQGVRGKDDAPYVVDTFTIPFDNPYRALFFTAGHDFLTDDAAMVCTAHGDVWLVTGLAGDLSKLAWKRYATGLFQPLGMVIRKRVTDPPPLAPDPGTSRTSGFDILVLGRDHITRLHDVNSDDEADYYEVFHEDVVTSAGGHDYVTCLETDSIGRLYYLNAVEGLVRVSPDGRHKEIVATGFRNPNGLGVGPNGEMTVAPQEGEWTPASGIFQVREGGYGGYGGPQVKSGRPLGYDPPLCWIPRRQDNSSGGQVWVTSPKWGPLAGKMLHTSFGQCTVQLVLTEFIHGLGQGGTVVLPPIFESGICRGRFSPYDGQLYLTGLRGWTTAATQDGCLQRLRYTGQAVHLPLSVATLSNGLMLTFSQPLNRDSAEDPDNYFAEQWNITYRKEYGSPEFKVSNPKEEGRDPVEILSATLLDDQRTVFLETPPLQPVSQFVLSYTLEAQDGVKLSQKYAHTIHQVREAPFDPAKITRRPRKGQLTAEEQEHLQPGMKWTWRGHPTRIGGPISADGTVDCRVTRLASLFQELPCETDRGFSVLGEGLLYVPLKGDYRFRLEASSPASLTINQTTLVPSTANGPKTTAAATLHKGYNRVLIHANSDDARPLTLRLLWSSDTFAEEPVPPDALLTAVRPGEWQSMLDAPSGRSLIATHNCGRCHPGLEERTAGLVSRGAPSLEAAGSRFTADWLAAWIADPQAMRPDATMPAVLAHLDEKSRSVAAADLAAYLTTLSGERPASPAGVSEPDERTLTRGGELYENLGCLACHRFSEPAEDDPWKRVTLAAVASKFPPGALAAYLQAPHQHFATSWMPDFRLRGDEADALAAYLNSRATSTPAKTTGGDANRGRELFQTAGCQHCHATAAGQTPVPGTAVALGGFGSVTNPRGCLARAESNAAPDKHPTVRAPQFAFTPQETAVLRAALESPIPIPPHPAHETKQLMATLRCTACHDRDGQRSPRMEILADEGSGLAPEQFPALTWTGDRLKGEWVESFVGGKLEVKPRQWLQARMPAFPAYAHVLAEGLAAEHGHAAIEPAEAHTANAELAAAGRELLQSTGLDCRQCHGLGSQPPTGDKQTLLAPGINFSLVKDRMRPEFYHRWMLDPPRFDLNTRMPKLAIDGKSTKVTRILDGDARRQFDAIWEFLQETDTGAKAGR